MTLILKPSAKGPSCGDEVLQLSFETPGELLKGQTLNDNVASCQPLAHGLELIYRWEWSSQLLAPQADKNVQRSRAHASSI